MNGLLVIAIKIEEVARRFMVHIFSVLSDLSVSTQCEMNLFLN